MLRADEIWCQLFSEPAAGSDLAGLRTTAVRDGNDWILNGQKIWTSGAHYCKWGMIVTRTDPAAKKHAGITYFIVDMEAPGVEIRPIKQINGASDFNEVFFTDVRVPDENRVGAVNDGWRCALTTLMNERASIGSGGGLGVGINELMQLARETDWNGRPALEDPSVRQRIADFYIGLKGLEYTSYRTLTALSRGQTPGPENSIGKMVGAPLRQEHGELRDRAAGRRGRHARRRRDADRRRASSRAGSARRACASPAAPTRSCTTSSPSACWACPASRASTRTWRSRTCRPAGAEPCNADGPSRVLRMRHPARA